MRRNSARMVRRTLGVLLTVAVLAGIGGAAWAAWSTRVTVTAGVSSGTWTTAPTPAPSSPTPTPSGSTDDSTSPFSAGEHTEFTTPVVWKNMINGQLSDPGDGNSSTNVNQTQCAVVNLRTTADAAGRASWTIIVDYSKAPFSGRRPTLYAGSETDLSGTLVKISAYNPWDPAGAHTVTLCDSQPANAADGGAGAYTVSTSDPQGQTLNNQQAVCSTVTVTGTKDVALYPFYYGWTTSIDQTTLVAAFKQAYSTSPAYFTTSPDPGSGHQYTLDGATSARVSLDATTIHTITSGWQSALQGHGTYSFDACVTQY